MACSGCEFYLFYFIILEVIVVNESNGLRVLKVMNLLFVPEYEMEFFKFQSLNSL
jgi:hypothetical protein